MLHKNNITIIDPVVILSHMNVLLIIYSKKTFDSYECAKDNAQSLK